MWTVNVHMFKLDLEKAEEPEIKLVNICWIIKTAREFQKNIHFFIDYARAFVWITTNWKILKEIGKTRPPYLPPEKSVAGQETVRTR